MAHSGMRKCRGKMWTGLEVPGPTQNRQKLCTCGDRSTTTTPGAAPEKEEGHDQRTNTQDSSSFACEKLLVPVDSV